MWAPTCASVPKCFVAKNYLVTTDRLAAMTDTPLMLAGDFATPTRQEWEAEVLKILNRRRPEGKN